MKRLNMNTVGRDTRADKQMILVWEVRPKLRGGKVWFTTLSNIKDFVPVWKNQQYIKRGSTR